MRETGQPKLGHKIVYCVGRLGQKMAKVRPRVSDSSQLLIGVSQRLRPHIDAMHSSGTYQVHLLFYPLLLLKRKISTKRSRNSMKVYASKPFSIKIKIPKNSDIRVVWKVSAKTPVCLLKEERQHQIFLSSKTRRKRIGPEYEATNE